MNNYKTVFDVYDRFDNCVITCDTRQQAEEFIDGFPEEGYMMDIIETKQIIYNE